MVEMKTLTIDGTTYEVVDEVARNAYSYGGVDLEAGVSPLATGRLYFVYEADIIAFTIDGISYQAESGMTWATWCDSVYNPMHLSAPDYSVDSDETIWCESSGMYVLEADSGDYVYGSQEITANGAYVAEG